MENSNNEKIIKSYEKRIRHNYSERFFNNTNKFVEFVNMPKWFFEDIKVEGIENVEKVKDKQIFYVSNHVSMADFLVQGHVFWKYGLTVPRFIGGENLFHFPFNIIWRKSGAMALDRKGNKEYMRVFKNEVEKCFLNRENILDYVEGGRNYEGKGLKKFKTGILGIALEAVEKGKEIYGVPVFMNYDKRVEEWALKKVEECRNKRDEHLKKGNKLRAKIYDNNYFAWDVAAYFVRPFVKNKGNAYVKFGEAFSLKEFSKNYDKQKKIVLADKFKTDISNLMG